MKPLFFATSAVVALSFLSCNSSNPTGGSMSDKAKKNLANADAIAKMFETGDYSKTGDYIAADAVDHSAPHGQEVKGLDSIRAEFEGMSKSTSNMKNETVKELADDDYVFQWLKETFTMKTDAMGMKAGTTGTINSIEVSKFNSDSKVTDHWSFVSMNDMMKMMPQQGMQNNMDSTLKKVSEQKK
jgi:SnoaL-like polyketide cyclase